jgi:hypothetical protein
MKGSSCGGSSPVRQISDGEGFHDKDDRRLAVKAFSAAESAWPKTSPAAVGGWEQDLAPWQSKEQFGPRYHQVRQARRMIENVRELMLELTRFWCSRRNEVRGPR